MLRYLLLLLCLPIAASAQLVPAIDGDLGEWAGIAPLHQDVLGDGAVGGIDFTQFSATCDGEYFYFMIDVGKEISLESDNQLTLYVDADCSVATGTRQGNLGAELVWNFGTRKGTVYPASGAVQVGHAAIGFHPAPTVTSTRFEFTLARNTIIRGVRLFPGDSIRIALLDRAAGGDRLPDGAGYITVHAQCPSWPPFPAIEPGHADDGSIRVLAWNVLQDGLFDAARKPAISRILQALKPDLICLEEIFDHSAADVQSTIASMLPAASGLSWHAYKLDAGNVLVTTADVLGSTVVLQGFRESAYLLRLSSGAELLVIVNHLRCCSADAERQQEADAIVAFLRDARAGHGRIALRERTPVLLVGDFNLVGLHRQLGTLLTGDIEDTARFGPDAAPGWNGRPLLNLPMRHLRSLFGYTWFDSTSAYASGKLDYVLLTPELLAIDKNFIFDAGALTVDELNRYGLQSDDSKRASDHLPLVVDMRIPDPVSAESPIQPSAFRVFPNPAASIVTVELPAPLRRLSVVLADALGRVVLRREAVHASRIALPLAGLRDGVYSVVVMLDDRPALCRNILKQGWP
jgi:endonuclease/exonuclease/phosphatase family metal-dependent hydrolase